MAKTFHDRRMELGRSIADCAKAFGVHRNTIARWDKGTHEPDEESAPKVAAFIAGGTLVQHGGRWHLTPHDPIRKHGHDPGGRSDFDAMMAVDPREERYKEAVADDARIIAGLTLLRAIRDDATSIAIQDTPDGASTVTISLRDGRSYVEEARPDGTRQQRLAVSSARRSEPMTISLEFEQEDDGRWIADVVDVPAPLATTAVYGATREEALRKVAAVMFMDIGRCLDEGSLAVPPSEVIFTEVPSA